MAFTKITEEDRAGKGNVGQPDTPLLTTTEMQEQMDSLPNLAIDKFNNLVDELADTTAVNNIGCPVPDGYSAAENLGSVLAAIALECLQSVGARHVHANKAALDTIGQDWMDDLDRIINLLTSVNQVEASITNSADSVPTSSAVVNYVSNYDFKQIIKNTVYPIGAVYQSTLIDPDSVFGTTGEWTAIKTDSDGVTTYKRIR